jgi:hypothetical protein
LLFVQVIFLPENKKPNKNMMICHEDFFHLGNNCLFVLGDACDGASG